MSEPMQGGTSPAILMVSVVPQGKGEKVIHVAHNFRARGGFIMYGQGTATQEIWERLGITKDREVVLFTTLLHKMDLVMNGISKSFVKKKANNGLIFAVPVDRFLGHILVEKLMKKAMKAEGLPDYDPARIGEFKQKVEKMMIEYQEEKQKAYESCGSELIIVRMANGYGQEVMDCARKDGAKGGTILHGRIPEAEEVKFFNITIEPEGDILFMLVNKKNTDAILSRIAKEYGLATPAHAIGFVVPVLGTSSIGQPE